MAAKLKPVNAGWVLVAVYILCIPAFLFDQSHLFARRFFWIVLLCTCITLLCFHKKWTKEFVFSLFLVGASGFLLEVLAAKTGYIYGYFLFGPALGYTFWQTPLMMAVLWICNIYTSRQVAGMIASDTFVVSVVSACLVLLLCFFIEPFAVREAFWHWNGNAIPIHKYIGVFIAVLLIQYVSCKSIKIAPNKLGLPVYLVQLGFFIAMYLLNRPS